MSEPSPTTVKKTNGKRSKGNDDDDDDDDDVEETQKQEPKRSKQNAALDEWAQGVLQGALNKDALTAVLMSQNEFEHVEQEGFDDDFQNLCLAIEKEEDDEKVGPFRTCGPGASYASRSYESAAKMVFDDYKTAEHAQDEILYVYSGNIQNWGEYNFDWDAFVKAAKETRLNGPWSVPRLAQVLETLHKAMQKE